MKTPHSCCRRGKRIRLVLRSGAIIVSKFIERTGKFVILESGRYEMCDIKSFTINKNYDSHYKL